MVKQKIKATKPHQISELENTPNDTGISGWHVDTYTFKLFAQEAEELRAEVHEAGVPDAVVPDMFFQGFLLKHKLLNTFIPICFR